MTTKTMRRLRGKKNPLRGFTGRIGQPVETDAEPVNSKEDDVPGLPPLRREPTHTYTTADIAWILRGGTTNRAGRPTHRRAMSSQAARNWLTAAHAKGEIDDEQLAVFWVGDGK